MKIRRGDTVTIRSGKDKSKQGAVQRVLPKENRVVVEGINMITRHVRATPGVRQGGRIQQEAPIHLSNVMLICPRCGASMRPSFTKLDNGSKVRVCRKCKETIS